MEDKLIMKKIEENQKKQASDSLKKTYIIDDFSEDLNDSQEDNQSNPQQKEKNYLRERRVTTVEE